MNLWEKWKIYGEKCGNMKKKLYLCALFDIGGKVIEVLMILFDKINTRRFLPQHVRQSLPQLVRRFLLLLVTGLFFCMPAGAVQQEDVVRLEEEMLTSFGTKDRERFIGITEELKAASLEVGDERRFYKAWGTQAVFEATQQNYQEGLDIAESILEYAEEHASVFGEYAYLHTKAMVLLQKQDYSGAEAAFIEAVEYHHRRFPLESAGEDLLELMTIAIHRNDDEASAKYARQILEEPNTLLIRKEKALCQLCEVAFRKDDVTEFNRYSHELMVLQPLEELSVQRLCVQVDYHIINGEYDKALELVERLKVDRRNERKALIYHRMGDDARAYQYMQEYKRISDSIMQESHEDVVASYYEQMNEAHLQLQRNQLESESERQQKLTASIFVGLLIVLLLVFLWIERRTIRQLRHDNRSLAYERKDAERALTDLNELSFFESKEELDLSASVHLNKLCNRVADSTQPHCYKGVYVMFQTMLPDDFEIQTEPEALRKLLAHLLHYSARFTHKGYIKLLCQEDGDNVLLSVTDTSAGLGNKPAANVIGMFSEKGNKVRYVGMNFNICQSITRLLHGRIWHDAEYTSGTRFYCQLPKSARTAVLKNRTYQEALGHPIS